MTFDHGQSAVPPPAQLLGYGWVERITDWRNAGRDGRAGLPDGEGGSETTPTVRELVRLFQERAASERWLMAQDRKDRRKQMAVLKNEIQERQDALERVRQEISAILQPTEEQLTERRGGEADTDERIIRDRRKNEYDDKRRTLLAEYVGVQRQLNANLAEYHRIQQEIVDRQQQMVNQWLRLYAHYSRRVMNYAKRLYRVHSDGQNLQAYLPELGQRELADALRQLLELANASYVDQQGILGPQLAGSSQQAITPGPTIDQPPKEDLR